MICENCIHKELCDEKEEDRQALKHCSDYFNFEDEALKTKKIGHWVKYCRLRCGEQHYQCTLCGYYINFGQWGEVYTKEFKYCPNCGSKMKGNG